MSEEQLEDYDNVETIPNNGCVRYDQCGNIIRGNGRMCPECLSERRAANRNEEDLGWNVE